MDPYRKFWNAILLILVICVSTVLVDFYLPEIKFRPSVRQLTVWEGDFQEVDCYVLYNAKTGDLKWRKREPEGGTYTIESRTDDNGDGTFTFHSFLRFKSFTSSDAGIYDCTFIPRPSSKSHYNIKLDIQKECEAGKYGLGCTSSCSEFCKVINTTGEESPCNYKDGHCHHGCLPGYQGYTCSSECEAGKYGKGCSSNCSEFCKDSNTSGEESPCSHKDGRCLHGCLPGYQGANCSSVCDLGRYGPECSFTCSVFCTGYGSLDKSWCHPETGICVDGCQDGFIGKSCTKAEDDHSGVIGIVFGCLSLAGVIIVIIGVICVIRRKRIGQKTDQNQTMELGISTRATSVNAEKDSDVATNVEYLMTKDKVWREKLAEVIKQLADITKTLTEKEQKDTKWEKSLEVLKKENKDLNEKLDGVNKQLADTNKKLAEQEQKNTKLEETLVMLQEQLRRLAENKEPVINHHGVDAHLEVLKKENKDLKEKLDDVNKQLADTNKKLAEQKNTKLEETLGDTISPAPPPSNGATTRVDERITSHVNNPRGDTIPQEQQQSTRATASVDKKKSPKIKLFGEAVSVKPESLPSEDETNSSDSDVDHFGDGDIALSEQHDADDEAAETGEETPLMTQPTNPTIPCADKWKNSQMDTGRDQEQARVNQRSKTSVY